MKSTKQNRLMLLPRYGVVGLIVLYQRVISPLKNALLGPGGCCRFYPTCSEYATESIKIHGVFKGLFYALMRLGKCHPFHAGGYDPVKPVTSPYHTLPKRESLLDLSGPS